MFLVGEKQGIYMMIHALPSSYRDLGTKKFLRS
jgi:hypothetical protein